MLWPDCAGSKVAATCRFGKSPLEMAESIGRSDCQGMWLNCCRVEVGVPLGGELWVGRLCGLIPE